MSPSRCPRSGLSARRRRSALGVGLQLWARSLAASLIVLALTAREARACSLIYVLHLTHGLKTAMMLATATRDSVYAGPGAVNPIVQEGHNGPVYDRPIYGQVMRVDSALGPGARPGSRVVLVPWDYGPDCHAAPWGSSFLWRRLGTRGLYSATLRDSAYWASGIPTYDVFTPESEPYTDRMGGGGVEGSAVADPRPLTPEELFTVARTWRVVTNQKEADAAMMEQFHWAEANQSLARRPPLFEALQFAGYDRWRLRDVDLAIAGTYRVTYSIGRDSVVFYARTGQKVVDSWNGLVDVTRGREPDKRLAAEGYRFGGVVAADMAGLAAPQQQDLEAYIAADPTMSRTGTTWRGAMLGSLMPYHLASDSMKAAIWKMGFYVETTFTLGADGAATFEHRSQLPDGRAVSIRGVRISTRVR